MDSQASAQPVPRVPTAVRRAAVLVGVEGVLLLAAAVWLVVLLITEEETDQTLALVEVGIASGAGLALVVLARGLARRRSASRAPVVVMQLLALPVGWTLLGGGLVVAGVVVLALAFAVLLLLFLNPAARESLERRTGS